MILAIVGTRHNTKDFEEISLNFFRALFKKDKERIEFLITGGAIGIDKLAESTAKEYGIPVKVIRPDNPSIKYHYILRNYKIVNEADKVYAFWDGKSAGTRSVINYARKINKYLVVVEPKP